MSTGLSVLFFFFCNICADLRCCVWAFSLAAESGGYFLAAMHGLLIAVASLVAEHRLQAHGLRSCTVRAPELQHAGSGVVVPRIQSSGSVVVVPWLGCPETYGIFPDQGSNWCPLYCKVDS